MAITFRNDKGSVLTWGELDINFTSFFYSASLDGSTLNLHYTSSAGNSIVASSASLTLPGVTAAGSINEIQYNDGVGGLAAHPSFTFDASIRSFQQGESVSASGMFSHAEGQNATASGDYSHAEGVDTIAGGNYSHAEGSTTTAGGNASHAEGYDTTTNGGYSHAEGVGAITDGAYSHAEGYYTNTIGNYSHAEGYSTTASGIASHAEGYYTQTNADYQHVSGKYNTTTDTTSLFIVGNGTSTSARKDAFKVTHSSSIVVATASYGSGPGQINNYKPIWTGKEGEITLGADKDGVYWIYVYINGNWKSGSLH